MPKYLHTFIRFLWLLIIPIAFAVAGGLLFYKPSYTAIANLWVTQPLFVDAAVKSDGLFYQSPSAQVADLFNELMGTRSFVATVLKDSPAYFTANKGADLETATTTLTHATTVSANGWRLVSLSTTASTEEASVQAMTALVTHMTAYYNDNIVQQAQTTLNYQQSELTKASTALNEANAKLADFINVHPDIAKSIAAGQTIDSAAGVEYTTLVQTRNTALSNANTAQAAVSHTQDSYTAYQQGLALTLRVQDKPQIIPNGSSKLRSSLITGGIGLGVGLALVAGIVALLAFLDSTLLQPNEVRRLYPDLPILTLSEYRPRKSTIKARRTARTQPSAQGVFARLTQNRVNAESIPVSSQT